MNWREIDFKLLGAGFLVGCFVFFVLLRWVIDPCEMTLALGPIQFSPGFPFCDDNISLESYQLSVKADAFEDNSFPSTNIWVQEGDLIEIEVMSATESTWWCMEAHTTALGLVTSRGKEYHALPTANGCALIGRIGTAGPYFPVGAYKTLESPMSGNLYLGANDSFPEECFLDPPEECFEDNDGEMYVTVEITRR